MRIAPVLNGSTENVTWILRSQVLILIFLFLYRFNNFLKKNCFPDKGAIKQWFNILDV